MAIQVKFFEAVLGDQHRQASEDRINGWLKSQPEGFKLHQISTASMGEKNLQLGISIWYEILPSGPGAGTISVGGERRSADYPGLA